MCGDLFHNYGIVIKKQSLQQRFNSYAVDFLQQVLSVLLGQQIKATPPTPSLHHFNRVRIKDSTRFALPEAYAEKYAGHGGATANSESMISIQYEYELLSGQQMDLRLTSGRCNDQHDAKQHTDDIQDNDLFIRDLGYCTLTYLKQIVKNNAYFLNRLNPQTNVYYADQSDKKVDFAQCLKRIKKYKLPYLELNVLIGKKAQLSARMIIYPADQDTYEQRLRKTQKQAKSCGNNVSDNFKTRAKLSIYITNADAEIIPASQVKPIYSLRWQIELTFKVWKSQGQINQIKEMKIHRFECQLIAKLIWLLIHRNLYQGITQLANYSKPEHTCSIWKYYKHVYRINDTLRSVISQPNKLYGLVTELIQTAEQFLILEVKNGKTSHYETIKSLA